MTWQKLLLTTLFGLGASQGFAQKLLINIHQPNGIQQIQLTPQNVATHQRTVEQALLTVLTTNNAQKVAALFALYKNLPQTDPMLVRWSQSLLASSHNLNIAIQGYKQLLQQNPELWAARLQLAQLLMQKGERFQATKQLQMVRQVAPTAVQNIAKDYLNFLRPEQKWQYDFALSYLRDNNLTNIAPAGTQAGNWVSTAKRQKGYGASYAISARRGMDLDFLGENFENAFARLSLRAQGKIYNVHNFDELDLHVQPAVGYNFSKFSLGISPFFQQSYYGGGENGAGHLVEDYRVLGTRLFAHFYPMAQWRISPFVSLEKRHYYGEPPPAHDVYYGAFVSYFLPKIQFDVGLTNRNHISKTPYESYHQWRVWGNVEGYVIGDIGSAVSVSYSQRHYHAPIYQHSLVDFMNKRRRDRELGVDYSIWYKTWQFKGIQPRLTFQYKKFHSTDIFKNHTKKQVFLHFSKSF